MKHVPQRRRFDLVEKLVTYVLGVIFTSILALGVKLAYDNINETKEVSAELRLFYFEVKRLRTDLDVLTAKEDQTLQKLHDLEVVIEGMKD